MSDPRPIGVFDSGLGGLTVVRELFRLMPRETIMYLGDTARCPYGVRSDDTIRLFGAQDARFLLNMDIKMLIVACNTVSAVALDHVRDQVKEEVPVIGVVLPGCKAAAVRTADKKIGVIGTAATIRTKAYTKGIQNIDPSIVVFGKECPLFVPLVEEGLADSDISRLVAQHYLYDLVDTGIDCLILGCTHYPLLMEVLQETVSTQVQLVDSAMWTAREAQDILTAVGLRAAESEDGFAASRFSVTDRAPGFEQIAACFLGREIDNMEQIGLEVLAGPPSKK